MPEQQPDDLMEALAEVLWRARFPNPRYTWARVGGMEADEYRSQSRAVLARTDLVLPANAARKAAHARHVTEEQP